MTDEQQEMYGAFGMTFELCKICDEFSKDTCIEPCNHLICSGCLRGWLEKGSGTCPFCRQEIKGHHSIQLKGFDEELASGNSRMAGETVNEFDEQEIDASDLPDSVYVIPEVTTLDAGIVWRCLTAEGFSEEHSKSACQLAGNNIPFARAILTFVANYREQEASL